MTKRIVVVGGGYGGIALVRGLEAMGFGAAVTLIDRHASHTVLTEVHRVAAGREGSTAYQIPFAGMGAFRFIQAEVTGLEPDEQRILTTAGPVAYDLLVLAVGGVDNDFGVPGVREHAHTLHSLTDALAVRNRLADLPAGTPIVIAGGGFTGVELAAELGERYGGGENITLVEGAAAILPGLPPVLQRRARRRLGAVGVNVLTGERLVRVTDSMAHFADGSALPFGLLVWACGVRANPLIARLGLAVDRAGRAVVGPNLESSLRNVYAIGDCASDAPPTAQAAFQQGAALARHLAGALRGRTVPVPPVRMLGTLVELGHGCGAGLVAGLPLTGRVPAVLKRINVARWIGTAGGWVMAARYLFGIPVHGRPVTQAGAE